LIFWSGAYEVQGDDHENLLLIKNMIKLARVMNKWGETSKIDIVSIKEKTIGIACMLK